MDNRMHRQGLDGRPRKHLAFLTLESGSPKKWCAIVHENCRNEGYAHFGACLTFQMGRTSRDGQLYAQTRSSRKSTKKFGIFDIGIRITQKIVCYSTRNRRHEGYARLGDRLTFQMGRTSRDGQPYAQTRSSRTSTKIFGIFDVGIRITQKMVCYSTQKSSK